MKLTIACDNEQYETVNEMLKQGGYIMVSAPTNLESQVFFYVDGLEKIYEVSIVKRRHGGLVDTSNENWEGVLLSQLSVRGYKKHRVVSHLSPNLYVRLERFRRSEGDISQSAAIAMCLNNSLPHI